MKIHNTRAYRQADRAGFAPKMRIKGVCTKYGTVNVEHETNFDVGELIEMLMTIKGVKISFEAMYGGRLTLIVKRLVGDKWDILYGKVENEITDLLFDCIIKLKEEGVLSTPQPKPKRTIVDFYECKACGRRLMIQQGLPHDVCPNCDSTQIERISLKKAMGEDEDN